MIESKWTREEREAFADRVTSGEISDVDLAKELGVTRTTIHNWVKKSPPKNPRGVTAPGPIETKINKGSKKSSPSKPRNVSPTKLTPRICKKLLRGASNALGWIAGPAMKLSEEQIEAVGEELSDTCVVLPEWLTQMIANYASPLVLAGEVAAIFEEKRTAKYTGPRVVPDIATAQQQVQPPVRVMRNENSNIPPATDPTVAAAIEASKHQQPGAPPLSDGQRAQVEVPRLRDRLMQSTDKPDFIEPTPA